MRPAGKMGSYAAVFVFAVGIVLSSFVWNTFAMKKPLIGDRRSAFATISRRTCGTHMTGVLGGVIWGAGMSFNLIASGRAGFAISYGLGQGATMVAAFWGVFIWKEFRAAPRRHIDVARGHVRQLSAGLALIVLARTM